MVGSKYAAVVDGRLMVAALIEDCERITTYHTDIPEPAKDALLAALRACHEANKERNRVIHDTWAGDNSKVTEALLDTLAYAPETAKGHQSKRCRNSDSGSACNR